MIDENGRAVVFLLTATFPDGSTCVFGVHATREGACVQAEKEGFAFTTNPIGWFRDTEYDGLPRKVKAEIEEMWMLP